jgi:hypothetical protein
MPLTCKETELILYHDYVFWLGDLNFRLQEDTFSFQQIQLLVEKKELSKVQSSFFSLSGRVADPDPNCDPDSIGSVDPDPASPSSRSSSWSRRKSSARYKAAAFFSLFLAGLRIRIQ